MRLIAAVLSVFALIAAAACSTSTETVGDAPPTGSAAPTSSPAAVSSTAHRSATPTSPQSSPVRRAQPLATSSRPARQTAPAQSSPAVLAAGSAATSARSSAPAPSRRSPPSTSPADGNGSVAPGTVVVLDPGHDGGNAAHPEIINALVPAGFGRTKPCNTTGTATDGGYPEHAFTWAVALRVRTALEARGIRVVLTRPNDVGVGPCVDVRAAIGNRAGAAAVVSIHGDGSFSGHGFHVIEDAADPGGPAVAAETTRLGAAVHAAMLAGSGMTDATYIGNGDGYSRRTDLAGLNLSTRPTVMVECGNMRDPHDAALMASAAGQSAIANSIAGGIVDYLANR